MRWLAAVLIFVPVLGFAQEQEKKLLDRLLKPNMTLQNDVQQKQFAISGQQPVAKQARTKWFFFKKRAPEKGFWDTRQASPARQLQVANAREAGTKADLRSRSEIPKANVAYAAPAYRDTREARDAARTVPVREYTQTRAFLGKGTRQNELSQQDRPLTIDQVRELLNKND